MNKIFWQGKILGVQPRIRLLRSFDESSHSYPGYNLYMDGIIQDNKRLFSIAIGKGAQDKFEFEAGYSFKVIVNRSKIRGMKLRNITK